MAVHPCLLCLAVHPCLLWLLRLVHPCLLWVHLAWTQIHSFHWGVIPLMLMDPLTDPLKLPQSTSNSLQRLLRSPLLQHPFHLGSQRLVPSLPSTLERPSEPMTATATKELPQPMLPAMPPLLMLVPPLTLPHMPQVPIPTTTTLVLAVTVLTILLLTLLALPMVASAPVPMVASVAIHPSVLLVPS